MENQYKLKSELGEVKKGNAKRKSSKNFEVMQDKQVLILLLNILKELQKLKVEQNKKEWI